MHGCAGSSRLRSASPASYPTPRLDPHRRCTDSDRERAIARLKWAAGAGAIDLYEFESRLERALSASSYLELEELVADLPGEANPGPRRSVPPPLGTYLGVIGLLVVVWLVTSPGGYFWPMWPALGWGIPLLVKYRGGERGHWQAPDSNTTAESRLGAPAPISEMA